MGKVRTRVLGVEDIEKEQKEKQKERSLKKGKQKVHDIKQEEKKEDKLVEKTDKAKTSTKAKKLHVRGKKYQASKKKINKDKKYSVSEALKTLKSIKYTKFDESVEIHMNVEEKGLNGEVEFPNSIGKSERVSIVNDELLEKIEKGIIEFDVLISHPSFMPKLAKYAKVLGPKGLMPNPKTGTISTNPESVVKKYNKGTLRWKTESKFPLIHQMIGKISFDEKQLVENIKVFIDSVQKNKIQKMFIKTTMSPSIEIDLEKI